MSEPDRGRSSEHDRLSARTVRRPRLRRQGSRRGTDHAGELLRRAAMVSDRRAGPAVRPDSAAGRHAVGQSGGHPDRIAAGAFRRHLHGRAGRLAAAPDAETRDRAAGRHSVGRLRILRARRGRAAGTRRLRPAGRRDGTRRQPDSGNHGAADDHHRRRGYDPHDSPSHARIESGARRDALADDPPGRVAVLGLGHRRGGRAGHRPRGRRNDGRADGNRQCRRRAALAARARADDSRDDRRRGWGRLRPEAPTTRRCSCWAASCSCSRCC